MPQEGWIGYRPADNYSYANRTVLIASNCALQVQVNQPPHMGLDGEGVNQAIDRIAGGVSDPRCVQDSLARSPGKSTGSSHFYLTS